MSIKPFSLIPVFSASSSTANAASFQAVVSPAQAQPSLLPLPDLSVFVGVPESYSLHEGALPLPDLSAFNCSSPPRSPLKRAGRDNESKERVESPSPEKRLKCPPAPTKKRLSRLPQTSPILLRTNAILSSVDLSTNTYTIIRPSDNRRFFIIRIGDGHYKTAYAFHRNQPPYFPSIDNDDLVIKMYNNMIKKRVVLTASAAKRIMTHQIKLSRFLSTTSLRNELHSKHLAISEIFNPNTALTDGYLLHRRVHPADVNIKGIVTSFRDLSSADQIERLSEPQKLVLNGAKDLITIFARHSIGLDFNKRTDNMMAEMRGSEMFLVVIDLCDEETDEDEVFSSYHEAATCLSGANAIAYNFIIGGIEHELDTYPTHPNLQKAWAHLKLVEASTQIASPSASMQSSSPSLSPVSPTMKQPVSPPVVSLATSPQSNSPILTPVSPPVISLSGSPVLSSATPTDGSSGSHS